MNKMRRNLCARYKSYRGYAKPEEFSPKQQNHNADQRANDRHREMNRRKEILDSHGCRRVCGKGLFYPARTLQVNFHGCAEKFEIPFADAIFEHLNFRFVSDFEIRASKFR